MKQMLLKIVVLKIKEFFVSVYYKILVWLKDCGYCHCECGWEGHFCDCVKELVTFSDGKSMVYFCPDCNSVELFSEKDPTAWKISVKRLEALLSTPN